MWSCTALKSISTPIKHVQSTTHPLVLFKWLCVCVCVHAHMYEQKKGAKFHVCVVTTENKNNTRRWQADLQPEPVRKQEWGARRPPFFCLPGICTLSERATEFHNIQAKLKELLKDGTGNCSSHLSPPPLSWTSELHKIWNAFSFKFQLQPRSWKRNFLGS